MTELVLVNDSVAESIEKVRLYIEFFKEKPHAVRVSTYFYPAILDLSYNPNSVFNNIEVLCD